MGQIQDKEITKSDICYDFFAKQLIEETNLTLIKCKYPEDIFNYSLRTHVIYHKGMYFMQLDKRTNSSKRLIDLQRDMLMPFISQRCVGPYIDHNYSIQSCYEDPVLFLCGFSHGNFCNCIAVCTLSFNEPDFMHKQLDPDLTLVPSINVLCSFSFIKKQNQVDLVNIKIKFGQILMYFALKYCQELHYSYVQLECFKNLIPFYMDVCGFKLGSCPSFNLTQSLYQHKKIHKVVYTDEKYQKAIDDS